MHPAITKRLSLARVSNFRKGFFFIVTDGSNGSLNFLNGWSFKDIKPCSI